MSNPLPLNITINTAEAKAQIEEIRSEWKKLKDEIESSGIGFGPLGQGGGQPGTAGANMPGVSKVAPDMTYKGGPYVFAPGSPFNAGGGPGGGATIGAAAAIGFSSLNENINFDNLRRQATQSDINYLMKPGVLESKLDKITTLGSGKKSSFDIPSGEAVAEAAQTAQFFEGEYLSNKEPGLGTRMMNYSIDFLRGKNTAKQLGVAGLGTLYNNFAGPAALATAAYMGTDYADAAQQYGVDMSTAGQNEFAKSAAQLKFMKSSANSVPLIGQALFQVANLAGAIGAGFGAEIDTSYGIQAQNIESQKSLNLQTSMFQTSQMGYALGRQAGVANYGGFQYSAAKAEAENIRKTQLADFEAGSTERDEARKSLYPKWREYGTAFLTPDPNIAVKVDKEWYYKKEVDETNAMKQGFRNKDEAIVQGYNQVAEAKKYALDVQQQYDITVAQGSVEAKKLAVGFRPAQAAAEQIGHLGLAEYSRYMNTKDKTEKDTQQTTLALQGYEQDLELQYRDRVLSPILGAKPQQISAFTSPFEFADPRVENINDAGSKIRDELKEIRILLQKIANKK